MKILKYLSGILATVLAIISMTIFARITWNLWDSFVIWLTLAGFPQGTEILLGLILFVVAVGLGVVQLKKFKKK